MIKPVILLLTWVAVVTSDNVPKIPDNIAVSSDIAAKVKRYYNHDVSPHKSPPCPPFYPHLHEIHSPIHLTQPYGPPAYPKSVYKLPSTPIHHTQYIHQPTYMSYVPKQTISYVKPHIPIVRPTYYHYLPLKSQQTVHQVQPIHQVIEKQAQWQYHQPQQHYQKPHFAYAPIYHKPIIHHQQPIAYVKPMNYHFHGMPGIVYKMEPAKCVPCHQHQIKYPQPIPHHYPMTKIIHVNQQIQPIHHPVPVHHPSPIYLPTSHANIQPAVIKSIGHDVPCTK